MRVAVIGAGLAGLGCAWHLIEKGMHVTLFDRKGIASGASGIAPGLLHPFRGKKPALHPFGIDGMRETLQMIHLVEEFGQKTVFEKTGVVRFLEHSQTKPTNTHLGQDLYQFFDSNASEKKYGLLQPSIFIENAGVFYAGEYLEILFELLQTKGLLFVQQEISAMEELDDFDVTIVAAGGWSLAIRGVELDLQIVKGQLVVSKNEVFATDEPPRVNDLYALNAKGQGIVGATFERGFTTEEPDPGPIGILLGQRKKIGIKELTDYKIRTSLRAYGLTRNPIAKQMSENRYALTGLGSRGMLLHALFAKMLVKQICEKKVFS